MGLGALNAAALNRVAINAAASTVLVLATASFSADATVTTATPTIDHGGVANIELTLQSVFGGYKEIHAFTAWEANGTSVNVAGIVWGASGTWLLDSTFIAPVYREVFAAAGFDCSSHLDSLADAVLVDANWEGEVTTEFVPTLIQGITGAISCGIATDFDDPIMDRGVESTLILESTLWTEGDITTGGVTTFDGHLVLSNTATFENANHLTATFTNGAFTSAVVEADMNAHASYAAVGNWSTDTSFTIFAEGVTYADLAWEVDTANPVFTPLLTHKGSSALTAGASIEVASLQSHVGKVTLASTNTFTAAASVVYLSTAAWTTEFTLVPNGGKLRLSEGDWAVSSTQINSSVNIVRYGVGTWTGTVTSLSSAAVVSLVLAPNSRSFVFSSGGNRSFVLSGSDRTFKVSI